MLTRCTQRQTTTRQHVSLKLDVLTKKKITQCSLLCVILAKYGDGDKAAIFAVCEQSTVPGALFVPQALSVLLEAMMWIARSDIIQGCC